MTRVLLEVCVETPDGLAVAAANGAGRIELCAALDGGGLTPSAGFLCLAAVSPVPVHVLIRPRGGGFVYTEDELTVMEADIAATRATGLAGIVVGASRPDGTLDTGVLRRLLAGAQGLSLTLHRAFDVVPDPAAALEEAVRLGFHRILSSGGAANSPGGDAASLAALVRQAAGRIVIMPGGGVTAGNAPALLAATGVAELHSSCRGAAPPTPPPLQGLGFVRDRAVDPAMVAALAALPLRAI